MRKTAILALLLCLAMTMAAQTETDNNNKQNNHPDTCVHLSEIVVTGLTGNTQLRNSPIPVNVISTEALQTLSFSNIIDAIAKYPGIAQITTGGGISKPVIRGMGYNRVLVVNDGVRQEGQQWGDEHGVEIDGESVHAVEVIKGPASLMYGSDAMAGVIIMHDAPVPLPDKMTVDLLGGYQSNANLWNYSVNFAGNQQGFVWDGRWSQKGAGEYENSINHKVENSQFTQNVRLRSEAGFLNLNVVGMRPLPISWTTVKWSASAFALARARGSPVTSYKSSQALAMLHELLSTGIRYLCCSKTQGAPSSRTPY